MIFIFYSITYKELKEEHFYHLLKQLPASIQSQVLKYRKWEDRQRTLIGKLLLTAGLKSLSLTAYVLEELKYTTFLKPYFDSEIDFNISHSGECVICAISSTNKIGIDVEEIQDVPVFDFENYFSKEEWARIQKADDSLYAFYSLWTQKESFIKAIGTGLHLPLNEVTVNDNIITWDDKEWFLHEIKLDQKYVAHLCVNEVAPKIIMKKIDFE